MAHLVGNEAGATVSNQVSDASNSSHLVEKLKLRLLTDPYPPPYPHDQYETYDELERLPWGAQAYVRQMRERQERELREQNGELTSHSALSTCRSWLSHLIDVQVTMSRHASIEQHLSSLVMIQLCSATPSHTLLTLKLLLRYVLLRSVRIDSLPSTDSMLVAGRDRQWILIIELEESKRAPLGLLVQCLGDGRTRQARLCRTRNDCRSSRNDNLTRK